MNDLISRQAAIDAIEEYADRLQMVDWKENPGVPYKAYALNWCINTIRDLPSAQPVQWIPVSERMPEPRIDVWCNSDMGQMVGYYDEYVETWYGRDYLELIVTAWMPLPEPWEGEGNERA